MVEITDEVIQKALKRFQDIKQGRAIHESTFVEDFWILILSQCPEVIKDECDGLYEVMNRFIDCYKEHGDCDGY